MDGAMVAEPLSATAIADGIKTRIHRGAYAPGQRLIEVDLAEEFSVGRGRIREVFKTLVGEGYLEFIENRGVYVRRFTRAEILDMGRVREVLEGLSARLAAEKELTADERETLRSLQDRLNAAEAANAVDVYNNENFEYHSMICRIAGNHHLEQSLARVRLPLYRLQLPRSFTNDSMANSNRDHQVVTSCILAGKPDAAEAAMRAHVRAGNQHVLRLAEEHFR